MGYPALIGLSLGVSVSMLGQSRRISERGVMHSVAGKQASLAADWDTGPPCPAEHLLEFPVVDADGVDSSIRLGRAIDQRDLGDLGVRDAARAELDVVGRARDEHQRGALQRFPVSGFQAQVDESWKTVVTFTPSEGRPGELRYRVYKNRYEEAEALMPAVGKRQPDLADNSEYAGYDGLITSAAEIDGLARPLRPTGPSPEPAAPTG